MMIVADTKAYKLIQNLMDAVSYSFVTATAWADTARDVRGRAFTEMGIYIAILRPYLWLTRLPIISPDECEQPDMRVKYCGMCYQLRSQSMADC